MVTRRQFIKTATMGTLGISAPVAYVESSQSKTGYFNIHQFVENHPEAVFIMRTNARNKLDQAAKLTAGRVFGKSVFVPSDNTGIPVGTSIPIKPNFKTSRFRGTKTNLDEIMGTANDPYFIEGMLEGMKECGLSGKQFHLREVNRPESFKFYGFNDMAERVGADLRLDLAADVGNGLRKGRDFNWTDVKNGVIFKQIPHLEPMNTKDSWMLNLSKLKTHPMGMTLCCKNLQGAVAHRYQQFCNTDVYRGSRAKPQHKNAKEVVMANYKRHVKEKIIPRWDKPGGLGGMWQEIWSSRTLDNISCTPCGLHIIEGIFSRDGNASTGGPHPVGEKHKFNHLGFSSTGKSKDFLTNNIIFGKDIFRVDCIGTWLAGHEPGNFGLFHLAIERGLSNALDPRKIPIYLWDESGATLVDLDTLERTKLLTLYLQKNYYNQDESFFHMLDEPFDYGKVDGISDADLPKEPSIKALAHNRTSRSMPLEVGIPGHGELRVDVINTKGEIVDVVTEGKRSPGFHLATWDASQHQSGHYAYRLHYDGAEKTGVLKL